MKPPKEEEESNCFDKANCTLPTSKEQNSASAVEAGTVPSEPVNLKPQKLGKRKEYPRDQTDYDQGQEERDLWLANGKLPSFAELLGNVSCLNACLPRSCRIGEQTDEEILRLALHLAGQDPKNDVHVIPN